MKRTEQKPPKFRRSADFPVDAANPNYLLKGIPPGILQAFDARAEGDEKSRRWLLLAFMQAYAAGRVPVATLEGGSGR